jgi:hypothetical protein
MKKWMTLLLCCVLALNLTACGAGARGQRAAAGEHAAL